MWQKLCVSQTCVWYYWDQRRWRTLPMSIRLSLLPESLGKGKRRRTVMFSTPRSAPSGTEAGGGWLRRAHAHNYTCRHASHARSTPTCSYSHICKRTETSTGAPRELHRWCLVWGLHSTSKGHLWHLRSLTNDDAQRSFATTKAEQKNWHEREVNKHKAFNKTFFFCWIHYKGFHCFFPSHDTTKRKSENCWVTWLTEKSGNNPVIFCGNGPALVRLRKCEDNWRQHCSVSKKTYVCVVTHITHIVNSNLSVPLSSTH